MERSLSVLLPVQNAQSTLTSTVMEILDILPELTPRFELVIIDDSSSDATIELAEELAACYPQINVVRHSKPLGREAAVRTGMEHSSGEIVFLRDEQSGLTINEVHKLWPATCEDQRLPVPNGELPRSTQHEDRERLSARRAGFQVVHRRTVGNLPTSSEPKRPNYLGRLRNFALGE